MSAFGSMQWFDRLSQEARQSYAPPYVRAWPEADRQLSERRLTKAGIRIVDHLGVNEPKLEERANLLWDSAAAEKARVAEQSAALTAQSSYQTALAKALSAEIAYCETSSAAADTAGKTDRITKSQAVYDAQVKANDAALKADVDLPFDGFAAISEKLPDVANPDLCA